MIQQVLKPLKVLAIVLAVLLTITSCKNESKHTNLKEGKDHKTTTYTRQVDCETFYQSIDFSSLCFTSDKTPKIQPDKNSGNRCQYKILLDDFGTEIYVLVNYHDYEKSIYNDPEMAKRILEQTFQKKRSTAYLFTKTTDANIGDDAYFGYHEVHKQKSLHVRMRNVVIAIQAEGIDKTNPCLLSNEELTKFAELIIKRIKN